MAGNKVAFVLKIVSFVHLKFGYSLSLGNAEAAPSLLAVTFHLAAASGLHGLGQEPLCFPDGLLW